MKLWHIVALVSAGLIYGAIDPGRLTHAFGQATLYVILPALLFEAAWNLRFRAMIRQWRSIAVLAIPGVMLTALLIAGALAVVGVPFGIALLTGAILSATDPIAVVAVFRAVRVPVTLRTIVECESLFNDAVAVALYRAVMAAFLIGSFSLSSVAFAGVVSIGGAVGGIAIGILCAFVTGTLLRNRYGVAYQVPATALCAYVPYFAAEFVHGSGIFATIAGGIALRYFERRFVDFELAEEVRQFWDVIALGANAVVFFLVGAALQVKIVFTEPLFVLATLAGVFLSRFAVAGLLLPGRFPRAWLEVIRVAGMRGALSLALAISLPADVPQRSAIVAATFAAVLFTIISSSLAVPRAVSGVGARTR